jgi:N-acetylneuraminic acid mutarotase
VKTADPLVGFVARERSAYTAAGSKVFIWGGIDATGNYLADGALYDPDTDTWAAVNATGAPVARVLATAVWTGSVVVVWGGGNGSADLTSGSRYDPVTNSWQAITTTGAPTGKRGSYAFWTGSRVLVWGGYDRNGTAISDGGLYDPVNDKWTATTNIDAPAARHDTLASWTGSLLLVYGGNVGGNPGNRTYSYNPASDVWNNTLTNGPTARWGAFGTWDGKYLTAWSGATPLKPDGKIYEPVGDKWTTMATMGQPASRWAPNRQTGWSVQLKSGITLMVGGMGSTTTAFFTNGGIYNSTTNSWSSVSAWPSGSSHLWGVGVWNGTEFVVWGGRTATGATLTAAGERYRP